MKYLVLDFGKVIVRPTTGWWFITPYFFSVIDMNKINKDKLKQFLMKHNKILSRKVVTEEEEYLMFCDFYTELFNKINYNISIDLIKSIAYNITYCSDKYSIYNNVKEELEQLSLNYTLIMLTDNWPCVLRILKEYNIYDYFDKIYVSSMYGYEKKDGILFDYVIDDYKIKEGDAIFIDDNEFLLDIANSKGFNVKLMNRENNDMKSKYEIINDLYSLIKYK